MPLTRLYMYIVTVSGMDDQDAVEICSASLQLALSGATKGMTFIEGEEKHLTIKMIPHLPGEPDSLL